MLERLKYCGSTMIGEKGQVVVPAEVRKKYRIKPGDRFLVLSGEKMGAWGIIFIKSDVISKLVEKMFGTGLVDIIEKEKHIEDDADA